MGISDSNFPFSYKTSKRNNDLEIYRIPNNRNTLPSIKTNFNWKLKMKSEK